MTLEEVIAHYGSKANVARALKIWPTTVSNWAARGYIPEAVQYKIQVLTKNKLKADAHE